MLEGILMVLSPAKKFADRFEKRHPVISLLVFQIVVAVFLLAAVGGIALSGGGVIWLFYHFVTGTM